MERQNSRPNVIVFFTDQQRWDTSGLHGNPLDLMPNFDRMAQYGTHIENCFTCQPVCGPARSVLQTGKYATNTGVFKNGLGLCEGEKTLAHYFKDAGYKTGYIGKWHLNDHINDPDFGDPVPADKHFGYDYWLGANILEFSSTPYNTVVYDKDGNEVKLPGYRVDALTDAAIKYVDDNKDQPFFLFLSHLEPHHQNQVDTFIAPDNYTERYTGRWTPPDLATLGGSANKDLGGYYGAVKRLDEAFGRFLDALKSLDLLDNTIVLFTSDHACHFKTRNDEHKRSCHESSVRIPAAIQGPGFNTGRKIQELVSLIDFTPTILDAAGLDVPEHMQGQSIVPLAKGDSANWPEEVFVQISEDQVGRAVRTHRWKYSVSAPDKNPVEDPASDTYTEDFLYDLQADPYELSNLIGMESHKEVTQVMRNRLLARIKQAENKEPTIKPAPKVPHGQRKTWPGESKA